MRRGQEVLALGVHRCRRIFYRLSKMFFLRAGIMTKNQLAIDSGNHETNRDPARYLWRPKCKMRKSNSVADSVKRLPTLRQKPPSAIRAWPRGVAMAPGWENTPIASRPGQRVVRATPEKHSGLTEAGYSKHSSPHPPLSPRVPPLASLLYSAPAHAFVLTRRENRTYSAAP